MRVHWKGIRDPAAPAEVGGDVQAAALLRIFVDAPARAIDGLRGGTDFSSLDQLARARSRIALQPAIAWQMIDGYRGTFLKPDGPTGP
jgi:hypothetical protein